MESRGNGWSTHVDGTWNVRGGPSRIRDSFFCFVWLIVFSLFAWIGAAQAQTTYVYDANGRVVAVTQANSTAEQYTYNTLGHPAQVSAPTSTSQLAIFAFMPTQGLTGTAVSIQGQGFSSNAASDTVNFNGVNATVLSASSSQLVVSVPGGATTGPISITVGSQTVTSAQPFVVDNGIAPTITQVTPVVAIGGTVTVTGANLAPLSADTTVQMAGIAITNLSVWTDTQLQYTVPSNAVSGHVTVNTLYGMATSTDPVAVLPSGVANETANAPTSYLTANGNPIAFSTESPGQMGVLTFDATQGDNLELTLNGLTITGTSSTEIGVTVYGPTGSVVVNANCSSTSPGASCRIPLWNLPAGTYAAVISPQYAGDTVSFNAILSPDAMGPALTANTPATVNLAAGEVERLTFTANAGGAVALQLAGVSTTPSGQAMYVQIYTPGTVPLDTGANTYTTFNTTTTTTVNLANLPSSGTYMAVVSIVSGTPGSAQLTFAPGVTAAVSDNGAAQSYQTSEGGQNVYMTFTANQGDNLELTINGLQIAGSSATGVYVNVYNANGGNVAGLSCYTTNPGASCRLPLWDLAAGTYTVIVSPSYSTDILSFNAILEPDTIGPALAASTPTTVNLAAGEVERLTFTANAGDNVALELSSVTTTPAGQNMYVQVYSPGTVTTTNAYTTFDTTSLTTANLQNLPATGTYTAIVSIISGTPGSAQLTLTPDTTGTITDSGNAQSYQANASGGNVYLTFNANQGDNLELTLNGITITGSTASGISVSVYSAAGANVMSLGCSTGNPGSSCRLPLWNLAAGTYSVVVSPTDASSLMSFNAILEPDTIGPVLSVGTPVTVDLAAGEVERLTFTANAGDTVALQLSGVNTIPAGQNMYVQVYSPGAVTTSNVYSTFDTSSSTTATLQGVPASGTYTAIVSIIPGTPGSAQLTLLSQ
jgi:YD repeat-containing protein